LARGEFTFEGQRLDLANVRLPMFVVGTETDHVAPWQSVYKTRGLTRSNDYTFLLTSGGHNAGIISGPVHPKRRHRVRTWHDTSTSLPPDQWEHDTPIEHGSWWPAFDRWLTAHSTPQRVAPPPLGNSAQGYPMLGDAPGQYVQDR
jgi:polyhydroxyalkanoate synthase